MASYCPLSPMGIDIKERIVALCAKVIAAPDGSKELGDAMEELRSALKEHAEDMRRQIANMRQKGLLRTDDTGEVESGSRKP